MAQISRKTKRYPSDLTDEEWRRIAPLMPQAAPRGRKRRTDLREVIDALRYLVRSGCGWEMLPVHFGPWQTVYRWFRRLMRRFLFQTIHDLCLMCDREQAGREASPSQDKESGRDSFALLMNIKIPLPHVPIIGERNANRPAWGHFTCYGIYHPGTDRLDLSSSFTGMMKALDLPGPPTDESIRWSRHSRA